MPQNRDEVPEWGRVRILQDAAARHQSLPLKAVIEFPPSAYLETGPYGGVGRRSLCSTAIRASRSDSANSSRWCNSADFNQRFYRLFDADWEELCEQWQLMTANMEYGYDVVRSAVDFTPGKPLPDSPLTAGEGAGQSAVAVAADRGWQNSGLQLEAAEKYRLTATGRFQVARDPKWQCEPGGISIRYYQGRPLGILLAAVRPDHPPPDSTSALLEPVVIGLGGPLSPAQTGTLFLKINHSPGELKDNAGELKVQIRRD